MIFVAMQGVTCGELATVVLHTVDCFSNPRVCGGEEVAAQVQGGPSRGIPSTVKVAACLLPYVPILADNSAPETCNISMRNSRSAASYQPWQELPSKLSLMRIPVTCTSSQIAPPQADLLRAGNGDRQLRWDICAAVHAAAGWGLGTDRQRGGQGGALACGCPAEGRVGTLSCPGL